MANEISSPEKSNKWKWRRGSNRCI